MKFKEIRWKNLLSYGNKIQSYTFGDSPKLVHIQGENGAGKSSIKEALTISTYGKSAIRKMKDIPNWINRNAYTYNEFETTSGDNIIIERGIDPNFHRIKINGVSHNLPDKKKIDEYIEKELLDLNFSIFCNTVSLSFDDFKSFVTLSAADKRKIIDPMFGIDVLNQVKDTIKTDTSKNKEDIRIVESEIRTNKNLLDNSKAQLESLKSKIKESNDSKIKDLKEQLKELNIKKEEHKKEFNKHKEDASNLTDESNLKRDSSTKANSFISECDKKLKIHDSNKCPHCLSDLNTNGAEEIKKKILDKKVDLLKSLKSINEEKHKIDKELEEVKSLQESAKEKFYSFNSNISQIEGSILELESQLITENQQQSQSSISDIIKTINGNIKELEVQEAEYREEFEVFSILNGALSDGGIKKVMIDKILPTLNSRIADISDRLEFKFQFEFDNEFNPIIYYIGMQISVEALSTGQRKKMNLIVLLAFIELIKMKYNKMNVLFLDEIFSGLDKNNVNMAIEILKEYSNKYNMTIFVVSHETLPEEFFDECINVTMPNHFSEMEIISNNVV
mgnify:CR=1 FL=1|tara:strand:- start:1550 stop:3238 length:1689 start_codon:yes stop_codon:yes gene_type:complete